MIQTPARHQNGQPAPRPSLHEEPREPPLLAVDGLSVHYGDRPALHDVTLAFGAGEIVSLVGPNGAGKSTLLKTLAGMQPPSHGTVTQAGQPLRRPHPAVTYVPQRAAADWLFPVSVLDTTLMGISRAPRWRPFSRGEKTRALEALAMVGMRPLADVQIGALSGGQQQRVFLARALLADGAAMLLDEPFSGVDVPTQGLLVDLFGQLQARGVTIIYATHDLDQAARASSRVVLLNRCVVGDGPPAEMLSERRLREAFGAHPLLGSDGHGGGRSA